MTKKDLSLPFLLGAFCGKVSINFVGRKRRGVVLYLPGTKAWIAKKLHSVFGGSIYLKTNSRSQTVCYALVSKKGRNKLGVTLKPFLPLFPELKPLSDFLLNSPYSAKPQWLGLRVRGKKRTTGIL